MTNLTDTLNSMIQSGYLFKYVLAARLYYTIYSPMKQGYDKYSKSENLLRLEVKEWVDENLDPVFVNAQYKDDVDGQYVGDDGIWFNEVVALYFQSEEDLIAFKLRWE